MLGPAAAPAAPRPPAGVHPRLLLAPADLPRLRAARDEPGLAAAWAELRRRAYLPDDYKAEPRYDLAVLHAAEATAFLGLVHDDHSIKRQAVALARRLLGSAGPAPQPTYFQRQAIGRCLSVVAQVYDWCHDALSAGERQEFCQVLRVHAGSLEMGFPPRVPGALAGHSSGMQLLRDLLAVALATSDEDPGFYDLIGGKFHREYAPARDFIYRGHSHHQGTAYGAGRFGGEIWSALWLRGVDAPEPWSVAAMSQVPYYFLYLRRPDGGFMKDGDEYLGDSRPLGSYWAPPAHHWLHYTALFQDPQFAAQWRRQTEAVETKFMWLDDPVDPILQIVFRPDLVPSGKLADLPLTRYFPEPMGAMIARTGWETGPDSRDVTAYLKIGTHRFDNHQHADSGQFQLYYRGSLALDSGLYASRTGAYGSPHFANYFRRTVAHNTLLIEEPGETFTFDGRPIINDGGQRAMETAFVMEEFWRQSSRTARVLTRFIGPHPDQPEVSLIKGDLTAAYSSAQARQVTRTMAFLPLDSVEIPAALVVLDDVESIRSDQRKVALLHSVEEPRIDGHTTTVTRTIGQIELLRIAPAAIDYDAARPDSAALTFDLTALQGRPVVQAQLACRTPWSLAGELQVLADGQSIAVTPMAEAAPVPLPEVTEWLRAATSRGTSAQVVVQRVGGDSRGVLEALEGPHAPHLRVWLEAPPTGGKLVQTTLLPLPADLDLRKVGGPGQEFVAGGQNFPAEVKIPEPLAGNEAGAWRVEVGDRSAAAATRFLNVYHVMDTGIEPPPVRLVRGRGLVGASFGGWLFLASDSTAPVGPEAQFTVTPEDVGRDGTVLLVLTDLSPGDHSLWQGEALRAMAAVEPFSHTLVTRLRPGDYVLKSR